MHLRRFAVAIALLALAVSGAAQDWKPVPGRMMTAWGEKVTPTNAWAQYPRPQFVRDAWQNLNGLWEYAILPRTAAPPTHYQGQILVPFCVESTLSGVGRPVTPADRVWYRRSFSVPAAWRDQRVRLNFEAVDFDTTVWVNGALVGHHTGGFSAFSFDLTDYLRDGTNELVVSVWDPTSAGEQPRGKQTLTPSGIWYTAVSGIWQTVWLEPVPREHHLVELRLTPDIGASRVKVDALIDESIADDTWAVRLTASAEGQPVASTLMRVNRAGYLAIGHPKLWTPDTPFLYDLRAELVRVKPPAELAAVNGRRPRFPRYGERERAAFADAEVTGAPVDTVRSYFAMRKISVGPGPVAGQPVMQLNDQPLFQHGTLDQGWWPDGLLTPPSEDAIAWELQFLKDAGFNMLRKHIKVEPRHYYYDCDRLGLLVWQDMPSGFNEGLRVAPNDEGEAIRRSTSQEEHELELRRMIDQLYSHPCIVTWIIHNEGWGQYDTAALAGWVKAIDPSRLVLPVEGWLDRGVGDVYSLHTYQPVPLEPQPQAGRAIVIGEYGGVGWPVEGHLWKPDMRNWGYQTYHTKADYLAAIRTKMEAIAAMRARGLSAAVYTQTSDVEGEVNGLLTYDRRVIKADAAFLAALNQKVIGAGAPAAAAPPH